MRSALWLLIGVVAIAAPLPVEAAPFAAPRSEVGPAPAIVQIDRRCGRGRHYVPRHRRARDGRIIRGHCAPNHR
ncbi:MAG: hypothetical protein ACLQJR_20585 [Stellaceae bacterium]